MGYQCPYCGIQGPPMYAHQCKKHYGFFNFIFDVFMICITGGLWVIWIFVREMRKN